MPGRRLPTDLRAPPAKTGRQQVQQSAYKASSLSPNHLVGAGLQSGATMAK